ncbi:GTPase family protein [Falsarthrobacter nasiphocae]|uniref:GTP-binding protein EngB required for normal cell division n=1 Tax=Falsarthrobacter nasiphocae TaxID=189863 RepID=A0AAE3YG63_9MICC|nr:GTPase [Falsarthrobacter nasiphocae]MDR6892829.1 GTP-binding protein EngB required for normal cell division [Falsarthrobacter nasiphocae]
MPRTESDLASRLESLEEARALGEDRLSGELLERAARVSSAAGERRRLSSEHTVVGFFGATGSGKSTLFNAVVEEEVARTAATRPTTSQPLAMIWGREGSEPLLDWLGVTDRRFRPDGEVLHSTERGSQNPSGLILLDLPDFDSTERANREVAERLAGQVDVLVWVMDPQKYADASVHLDFIRPLAGHGSVMLAVLNQIDRLPPGEVDHVVASLQGLLRQDGVTGVEVIPASARTGQNVDRVRNGIRRFADAKDAADARLAADVDAAARDLASSGTGEPAGVTKKSVEGLSTELAAAARVGVVADAVEKSYRHRSHAATGWPLVKWVGRFRPDPLRRLNLHRSDVNPEVNRSSMPPMGASERARADSAVRRFADEASDGATEAWRSSTRRAARSESERLPDRLDQALASADLQAGRRAWWWPVFTVLQWVALLTLVAGLGWLAAIFLAGYFQFHLPETPQVEGFPVPTLLVVLGAALGILLALLAAAIAGAASRIKGRRARKRLTAEVEGVARGYVVHPVEEELARYERFRAAVERASAAPRRSRLGGLLGRRQGAEATR